MLNICTMSRKMEEMRLGLRRLSWRCKLRRSSSLSMSILKYRMRLCRGGIMAERVVRVGEYWQFEQKVRKIEKQTRQRSG